MPFQQIFKILSFPIKKLGICLIGVVGICLWTQDVLAQEKLETEISKVPEKLILEDQTNSQENGITKIIPSKQPLTPINKLVLSQPKKEAVFVSEGKKPESTSSTLSFNIFLYIVDKFKSD